MLQHVNDKYYLVRGHTAVGVYKDDGPFDVYIDIKSVPELAIIADVSINDYLVHVLT